MTDESELAGLLREIRDQQRLQLDNQTQALALQREQFALVQGQTERAGRALHIVFFIAVPLLILLLVLMLWPVLARLLS